MAQSSESSAQSAGACPKMSASPAISDKKGMDEQMNTMGSEESAPPKQISFPVIVVIMISITSTFVVVGTAILFAAIQFAFFFALPSACLLAGSALFIFPDQIPLESDSPCVPLLLKALGALTIPYAAGAFLALGGTSRPRQAFHLASTTVALGAAALAIRSHECELLGEEDRTKVVLSLSVAAGTAALGAAMASMIPRIEKRFAAGKPLAPKSCD